MPPQILTPQSVGVSANPTDVSSLLITFTPVLGATEYEVQVSDRADFSSARTYSGPLIPASPGQTGTVSIPAINLSTNFPSIVNGQTVTYTLFIRVGARNNTDNNGNPHLFPISDPSQSLNSAPQFRFVFSPSVVIQTLPTPPPVPGGVTTGTTTGATTGPPGLPGI